MSQLNASAVVTQFGPCGECLHVNASGTTDDGTDYPFDELYYRTEWDDAGAGSFALGRQESKTFSVGPIAAHVYLTPGDKALELYVANKTHYRRRALGMYTVDDPDVVFAGNKTVVIATNGDTDFTGKPTGATEVTLSAGDDLLAAVDLHQGNAKRILLKRDGAYAASDELDFTGDVWILGAWGAGDDPVITPAAGVTGLRISGTNWRVDDIEIDGAEDDTTGGVLLIAGAGQGLFKGTLIEKVGYGLLNSENLTTVDDLFFYESTIQEVIGGQGLNGWYAHGQRHAFLGSLIDNTILAEHGYRTQYLKDGVFYNSKFSQAAGADSGYGGKTVHTLRGPEWEGKEEPWALPLNSYTENVVVAACDFVPHTTQNGMMGCGPSGDDFDERIRNIIYERCLFDVPDGDMQIILSVTASSVTRRNNRVKLARAGGNDNRCLEWHQRNNVIPDPSRVRDYNNSIYGSGASGTNFQAIRAWNQTGEIADVVAKNNLGWAPNHTSPAMTVTAGTQSMTEGNNSTDLQVKNTQPFVDTTDFVPQGYALGSGADVPVFDDFNGLLRGSTVDLGSVTTNGLTFAQWLATLTELTEDSSDGLPQRLGKPRRRRTFVDLQDKLVEVSGFQEAERLLGQLKTEEKLQEKERKRLKILLGRVDDRKTGVLYEATQKQIVSLEKKMDKRDERIEKLSELILKKLEESNEDDEEVLLMS